MADLELSSTCLQRSYNHRCSVHPMVLQKGYNWRSFLEWPVPENLIYLPSGCTDWLLYYQLADFVWDTRIYRRRSYSYIVSLLRSPVLCILASHLRILISAFEAFQYSLASLFWIFDCKWRRSYSSIQSKKRVNSEGLKQRRRENLAGKFY
jgi:hypothetical protein